MDECTLFLQRVGWFSIKTDIEPNANLISRSVPFVVKLRRDDTGKYATATTALSQKCLNMPVKWFMVTYYFE